MRPRRNPPPLPNFYRRNLPHFTPNDAPYFVTFNLAGSVPIEMRKKLLAQEIRFSQYDGLLDIPAGPKWLKEKAIAAIVFARLASLGETCEELLAFTIMPNHLHLLISLRPEQKLHNVMQRLKGTTARECNLLLGRTGAFWQHESYDRVMRHGEVAPTLRYIILNPVKAGLVENWSDWPYTYLNPTIDTASLLIRAS